MGYLDTSGLSHFWETVKTALLGKQDQLAPDETITMQNGGIGVKTPVKPLTQAGYDALTEEENSSETLYLVDEPPWIPAPLSIQEYDTEDGWHVRKWSDGYCELFYQWENKFVPGSFQGFGGLYPAIILDQTPLPFPLTKKYREAAAILDVAGDDWFKILGVTFMEKDELSKTGIHFLLNNHTVQTTFTYSLKVEGRWK